VALFFWLLPVKKRRQAAGLLLLSGTGRPATGRRRPRVCTDVGRHMRWSRATAPIRGQHVDPAALVGRMALSGEIISEEALTVGKKDKISSSQAA